MLVHYCSLNLFFWPYQNPICRLALRFAINCIFAEGDKMTIKPYIHNTKKYFMCYMLCGLCLNKFNFHKISHEVADKTYFLCRFWTKNIYIKALHSIKYSAGFQHLSTLKQIEWLFMLMVTKLTITSKNGKNKMLHCDCIALTFIRFSLRGYLLSGNTVSHGGVWFIAEYPESCTFLKITRSLEPSVLSSPAVKQQHH